MGSLPFAILFSADRSATPLVAAFSGFVDSGFPARVPRKLLLLPQGALSRVLAGPAGLSVGEPRRSYCGEAKFPFILQNFHRYFLYMAILFLFFLWKDAIFAFRFDGHFGIGVGTLVLTLNVTLLSLYTLSCHSLRHIIGGKLDCFSCATWGAPRHSAWGFLTTLNERHMWFAWCSLISVGLADLYVRLVASGAIKDLRIL